MKISDKALEDYKKQYQHNQKNCSEGCFNYINYHDWLNEMVECTECGGKKHVDYSSSGLCPKCDGKGIISNAQRFVE